MKGGRVITGAVAAVLLLGGGQLFAQEAGSPKPAAREYPPLGDSSGDVTAAGDVPPMKDDDRTLTGAEVATLGQPELRHSYFVPGVDYGNFALSSPYQDPTLSQWNSTSYVTGNLSLVQAWRHARLDLNYSGGGFFSTDSSVGNGGYQQVGAVQQFNWERWQLLLIDQFANLPEAQFGFGAGTNISAPGVGGTLGAMPPGLQSNYVPSQSIYSAIGPRYSNAFVAEVGRRLSPRSSLVLAGSYGLLHFAQAGNIDTNDVILNAGYEYELSRESTLGVLYRFTSYHFAGEPQAIGDHIVQLAYARKLTGRMALQLLGGPEITELRVPIGSSSQRVSGSGTANLTFAIARGTSFSAGYVHGVNGGSGVFAGGTSDTVQGGLSQGMGRQWRVGLHFGYSRTGSILHSTAQPSQKFNNSYVGADLQRALGRSAHCSLSYTANLESSNAPIGSITGASAKSYTVQQISFEVGWHLRPIVMR